MEERMTVKELIEMLEKLDPQTLTSFYSTSHATLHVFRIDERQKVRKVLGIAPA